MWSDVGHVVAIVERRVRHHLHQPQEKSSVSFINSFINSFIRYQSKNNTEEEEEEEEEAMVDEEEEEFKQFQPPIRLSFMRLINETKWQQRGTT